MIDAVRFEVWLAKRVINPVNSVWLFGGERLRLMVLADMLTARKDSMQVFIVRMEVGVIMTVKCWLGDSK